MFNSIAIGIGITAFGAFMSRAIQKNHDAMVAVVSSLLDKVTKGIGASEETQKAYHAKLLEIVSYVDTYANDPKFWRQVARTILSMTDPVKRAALLAQFDFQRAEDFLADNLPPELKQVVNAVKEQKAVEIAGAHASIALPVQYVATRDIKADVKAAVVAAKASIPEADVTKEQLEALLESHKAMKTSWMAHGSK